ncbi:MAG TPA: DUF1772 domain-containing protein [Acidobacteriaceae bacterium]|nr:DUF1772 domain-containing protein [Acidobacteriaceae bacterium]
MVILDIATTVCAGLLIGVEFSVSAFINPILWQLDERAQSRTIGLFARKLGFVMPFWYSATLLLLVAETVLRLHQAGAWLLGTASAIWIVVIVLTLLFLVPINNRMTRLEGSRFAEEARREHRKWDSMHRARVAALAIALVCLLGGVRG